MQIHAPTSIDFTRLPPPNAIEPLNFETLIDAFKSRFLALWAEQRATKPSLPNYTTANLESNPLIVIGQAWTYLRLLDRQRVNDGYRAMLAPLATGADLDLIAASRNIERRVVQEATETTPRVMESDVALLRSYLQSFDKPSAGSRDRYLYEAWRAWPQNGDIGLWDAKVNGFAVHGRKGDVDVVITGPGGRTPTQAEMTTVRSAILAPGIKPEATSVQLLAANRRTYSSHLIIEVPGNGPAPNVVKEEARRRVVSAATERILIGGEVAYGLLPGSAYGQNVIAVRDMAPVVIEPDPYTVPVMTELLIEVEVRG